jgi:hypothetical protein
MNARQADLTMRAANAAYLEKARADKLARLLAETLPYLDAAMSDPAYKPAPIRALARRIREAVE